MGDHSEQLKKLFESLGIKHGDPILNQRESIGEIETYLEQRDSKDIKEEDDWYDSLNSNSDDLDVFKEYGSSPPKMERNRKQRGRKAYCNHAVAAAKSFTKHKLASRCASLPVSSSVPHQEKVADSNAGTRALNLYKHRKRSQDLQRSYERQCKFRMAESVQEVMRTSVTSFDDPCFKCESLPPITLAVKVPPRYRYMSLSFKKIGHKDSVTSPRKFSTAELPADRVAFHSHLEGLLKHCSQDPTIHLKSQRSEEEVLYQQELNEMVWLELQAWHAGMNTLEYDNSLIEQRKQVHAVYEEVMKFNYNNLIKSENKLSETSLFIQPAGTKPDCEGCLSVWCEKCLEKQSDGLETVWRLLEKLDDVYALFPSTRKLVEFFPQWAKEEFVMRYKSMCLWFNTTSQLRFVIDLLGRRLGHMTKDIIPWPNFPDLNLESQDARSPTSSSVSKDSGNNSLYSEDNNTGSIETKPFPRLRNSMKNYSFHKSFQQTPVVRFEIEDTDEGSTTGSSDPNQSSESDFPSSVSSGSNPPTNQGPKIDHLSPPVLNAGLRRCSSDIFLDKNPYRTYVEKLLRNKGMKKTLDKVAEVIRDVMNRTICIIEESHHLSDNRDLSNEKNYNESSHVTPPPLSALNEELRRHKKWSEKFSELGLPHFHTLFLFLASVPLHMMRECLKLRLEQMPERPSRMSIKQLMREYKEGVKFAVAVRQKFVRWCLVLLSDLPPLLANNLEVRKTQAIEELDSNVKKMLEVYLEWLDQFILMLHREPHVAGLQRNFLQEEWRFVQSTCPHVTDGESLAATRFCNIACHMLCSVRDFLDTGLDDMISDFQASTIDDALDCEEEDEGAFELEEQVEDSYYEEEGEPNLQRRKLVQRCRSLQDLISEARERALRAIALAKMLKKDLEIAAEIQYPPDLEILYEIMQDMDHVLVKGHSLRNLLIFVPSNLETCSEEILTLLQMQMGEQSDLAHFYPFKYFILLNKPLNTDVQWKGRKLELQLTAECAITLSRIQVSGLMLIVKDGCQLQPVRKKLVDQTKGVLDFTSEQIAPHRAVTQSLQDMKSGAVDLCDSLEKSIIEMEGLVNMSQYFPNSDEECRRQLCHLTRDTIHQGFIFGFEYHKESVRLVSGKQRAQLSPVLINFGRHWMKFVMGSYSTGKGRRPRWALPGLEFLLMISEPHNTKTLSDGDFKNLRNEVEDCREYIIGFATSADSSAPSTPLLMARPFRSQSSVSSVLSRQSSFDSPHRSAGALLKSSHASFDKMDEIEDSREPLEVVRDAVRKLDIEIEEKRMQEKLIGRVSNYHRDLIEIKPHTVSFSWHRGFKIGAGHFGKVYTAVNNNSGELMAMKVLPLQPNDHRSIQRVASELDTFQRIDHPHLVKYYGVEIHNDEMLMFMEYCEEGTLEALAHSTEGLPEEIVRKYTRQLLGAVHTMHENSIVHRDIKGANIFLAQEGNILKLGDFGCAVRLRGLQTEIGELSGIVGTHAFMAPEIFRSNEGHGRAADIWSVGCVVIEMVTGKRPWPQYDRAVQIMFQVGNGKSPSTPEKLQEEGHDFLKLCFEQDPRKRATSARLLDHTFVKVEDEENASIPLFALMPFLPDKKS